MRILRREDNNYNGEALEFFRKLLLDQPTNVQALSELRLIYLDLGMKEERGKFLSETVQQLDTPPLEIISKIQFLIMPPMAE